MADFGRDDPVRQDWDAMASGHARLWMAIAKDAGNIAHAKRQIFLAYVAEGFNEHQALELVKTV